jgi:hypothetical protein
VSIPINNIKIRADNGDIPSWRRTAVSTPAKLAIDPIDRSIPEETITSVEATATITAGELWRSTLKMFIGLKNLSVVNPNPRNTKRKIITIGRLEAYRIRKP